MQDAQVTKSLRTLSNTYKLACLERIATVNRSDTAVEAFQCPTRQDLISITASERLVSKLLTFYLSFLQLFFSSFFPSFFKDTITFVIGKLWAYDSVDLDEITQNALSLQSELFAEIRFPI